jgi:hypothetical protein
VIVLAPNGRSATLTPVTPLIPSTLYNVSLHGFGGVTDLAGQPLSFCCSWSFTTGTGADATGPTVIISPPAGSTNVATNAPVVLLFSEAVRAATITPTTIRVSAGGTPVVGTFSQSTDLRRVTFTPSAGLPGGSTVTVQLNGVTDVLGNPVTPVTRTFTVVGGGVQNLVRAFGATVSATSTYHPTYGPGMAIDGDLNTAWVTAFGQTPAHGVPTFLDVPLGGAATVTELRIFGNRPWGTPYDFRSGTFQLFDAAGTELFTSGVVTFPEPRHDATVAVPAMAGVRRVRFTGASGGDAGYVGLSELEVIGTYANPADGGVVDTKVPQLTLMSPANAATGVPVTSAIVWTFDEPVDPTTVNERSLVVFLSSFSGQIGGQYTVNGNVVTLTPFGPLPSNEQLHVYTSYYEPVRDLAGNAGGFVQTSFRTAAEADTAAPTVLLVTPANGATGIGRNAPVVITFSESMNDLNNDSIAVFANGDRLFPSVSRTADNRTFTVNTTWAAGSEITVLISDGIADMAGNHLAPFRTSFRTAASFDTSDPFVVSQRPGNGATGVALDSTIVLYTNEPLNAITIASAFLVSENGALVPGSASATAAGRALTFRPTTPFAENALIEVFLRDTAQDPSGNSLSPYHASFRTVNTAGSATVTRFAPTVSSVVLNPRIEVEYSEGLNPATLTTTTVRLLRGGTPVTGTVSLERGDRVIRFVPDAALLPSTSYSLQVLAGVLDATGTPVTATTRSFTTGTANDTTGPVVSSIAPPPNSAGVGVNAAVRVRFNERINPLSVTGGTIRLTTGSSTELACTITFGNSDQDVVIVPHGPLADAATYTLTVSGVEDLAGNPVAGQTTSFTTASSPDFDTPQLVRLAPANGTTGVPLNAVFEATFNEPIDGGLIDTTSVRLRDNTTSVNVAATRQLSTDGRTLTVLPDVPLVASRSYSWFVAATDLANNATSLGFSYTTGTLTDTTPPQIATVSPLDGTVAVPLNTQLWVRFTEPIQALPAGSIQLTPSGGTAVAILLELSDGNRLLKVRPVVPLEPATAYTLTVVGIEDLVGLPLAAPTTVTMTTGGTADVRSPILGSLTPGSAAIGVATTSDIRATFNEPMNLASVTGANFLVRLGGAVVPGTISVSTDGLTLIFTPGAPLLPNTLYQMQMFSETDLAGNSGPFLSWTFTTGS